MVYRSGGPGGNGYGSKEVPGSEAPRGRWKGSIYREIECRVTFEVGRKRNCIGRAA